MIYKIFPSRDTFITNYRYSNIQRTGSNFGKSEVLHVFKQAPVSGAIGVASTASISKILMQFDLSEINSLITAGKAPSSGISYRFKLYDVVHAKTLPSSYDLETIPVSQSWDEGKGTDVDTFVDLGVANWDKAKSNLFWTSAGGTTASLQGVKFHFDEGHEDLDVDVTHVVDAWRNASLTNNGLMVRVSSSQEVDSLDYYTKMFYGREAFNKDVRPYLEASWDDSIKDDRNNFAFDTTCSLYLYNSVRGQLVNISSVGTGSIYTKIIDSSGTLKTITGSYAGSPGIYSATFAISTGSYSGSIFKDIWFSGSKTYMTCSFTIAGQPAHCALHPDQYFVNITNLKNEYDRTEVPRLNIFVSDRNYNTATVLTASSVPSGLVVTNAYYQLQNDRTDRIVVPFGTGSVETTRLSYDANGNYFKFYVSSLPTGNVYRIVFLFDVGGQKQIIDNGFKFRVL